jgi:xylulokinase
MRQTYSEEKPQIRRLVATAGGARSKLWRQIVTDILNMPMEYYPYSSGALGIAFLAGYSSGLISNFSDIKQVWLCNPQITLPGTSVALYDRYYEVYCEFEKQMAQPFTHLAQVTMQINEP